MKSTSRVSPSHQRVSRTHEGSRLEGGCSRGGRAEEDAKSSKSVRRSADSEEEKETKAELTEPRQIVRPSDRSSRASRDRGTRRLLSLGRELDERPGSGGRWIPSARFRLPPLTLTCSRPRLATSTLTPLKLQHTAPSEAKLFLGPNSKM